MAFYSLFIIHFIDICPSLFFCCSSVNIPSLWYTLSTICLFNIEIAGTQAFDKIDFTHDFVMLAGLARILRIDRIYA